MKLNTALSLAALALAGALHLGVSAHAQDVIRYRARPDTNTLVRINGSANIHEWEMEGNIIGGFLEVPAAVILDSSQATLAGAPDGKVKAKAHVQMPVTSIVNAKWDGMSQVMQDAMDAKNFPQIIFDLTDMTLKQPHVAGKPYEFEVKGEIAVHGVTNKITMPVTIESLDKTRLKVSAEKIPLSMPDFKVTPPVKAGIFITKPDITITFDWFIAAPAAKPADTK
jgi:hypothetical protein